MDHIDRMLLKALEQNAKVPLKQLAKSVFLSPPAVSARIERLEKEGIITGYHAHLDDERLGYHILAFVNLSLPPERHEEFTRFIERMPNVMECCHISGQYSMLIKVRFISTADLNSFVMELQKFGTTETQIVFSQVVKPRDVLE